jgi:hypothetical protein
MKYPIPDCVTPKMMAIRCGQTGQDATPCSAQKNQADIDQTALNGSEHSDDFWCFRGPGLCPFEVCSMTHSSIPLSYPRADQEIAGYVRDFEDLRGVRLSAGAFVVVILFEDLMTGRLRSHPST